MSGTPRCIKLHINPRNKKAPQPDLIWRVPCYCRCSLAFFPLNPPSSTLSSSTSFLVLLDFLPVVFSLLARGCTRVSCKCREFYNVRYSVRAFFAWRRDIAFQCAKFQYCSRLGDFNNGVFPAITSRVATICTTAVVGDIILGIC